MDICQIPTKGHVSCQSLAGQDWLPELLRHKIERDLPPVNQPMIIIIITVCMVRWNKGRYSSLATAGSALGSAGHRLMEMDGAPCLNSSLSSAKPIRILSVIAQIAADSPCHQFLPFIFSHPFPVISSNHPYSASAP